MVGFSSKADSPDWTKQAGAVYGEYEHQLKIEEMPSHKHSRNDIFNKFTANYSDFENSPLQDNGDSNTAENFSDGLSGESPNEAVIQYQNWEVAKEQAVGSDKPHNNVQPSKVFDIWRRIA